MEKKELAKKEISRQILECMLNAGLSYNECLAALETIRSNYYLLRPSPPDLKEQAKKRSAIMPFLIVFMLFSAPFIYTAKAHSFCFEEAGKEYNIAPELLYTISDHESLLDPKTVHYNKNGTYDYGLMGINSWWYAKLGPELWNALADPCTNVKVGAYILAMCIQSYGYNWNAVGCYHSPNEEIAARYITKIQEKIFKTKGRIVYAQR